MPVSCPEVGIAPDPNAVLWRYMELDRFKSFLDQKALFFSRADKFSDPFEGSIPKKEHDFRPEMHRAMARHYGNEPDEEQIAKSIADLAYTHMMFRRIHVVNCWHNNSNESDAMWRLYLKSNEGVAIQTTTARLIQSLEGTAQDIDISKVRYLDYDKGVFYGADYPHRSYNMFMPLIHKRNEFIHEREVRIIHQVREAENDLEFWDKQPSDKGMFIKLDIGILVDKVILPPTSDEKVRQEVEFLIKSRGYDFELEKSTLSKSAYF
ncbi:hypothetical protein Q5H93_09940 [Hymenobacter sp. ASUV-10]|uniref:DUF2971 domain-containing protein n=1 Tax=Hymenobacter aranciens TaxID=3063996 RepID=A0ABT9BB99_9BACT|nr:hypothetical protein [Hymenobacter sp. ASUV-10]MDO7875050.1 hypothetical protein [Hymenobacter sp. ASUV-10]